MAADIKVFSGGAVQTGLLRAAEEFKRASGNEVRVEFNTAPQLAKKLAEGAVGDILIAPPALLDEQARNGRISAAGRVMLGRVGAGVVVRAGTPAPNVATTEALKQAMHAADAIIYNTASSGLYLEKLFERIGIAEAIKAKTVRYPNGEGVMEHVIKGKGNDLGFGPITEIRLFEPKGLKLVGPLPGRRPELHQLRRGPADRRHGARRREGVHRLSRHPGGQADLRRRRHRIAPPAVGAPFRQGGHPRRLKIGAGRLARARLCAAGALLRMRAEWTPHFDVAADRVPAHDAFNSGACSEGLPRTHSRRATNHVACDPLGPAAIPHFSPAEERPHAYQALPDLRGCPQDDGGLQGRGREEQVEGVDRDRRRRRILHLLERLDGAGLTSPEVALGKARTAALTRQPTKLWEERVKERPAFINYPAGLTIWGGVPVIYQNECVGAIGVSGVASQDDEKVALAGVAALV